MSEVNAIRSTTTASVLPRNATWLTTALEIGLGVRLTTMTNISNNHHSSSIDPSGTQVSRSSLSSILHPDPSTGTQRHQPHTRNACHLPLGHEAELLLCPPLFDLPEGGAGKNWIVFVNYMLTVFSFHIFPLHSIRIKIKAKEMESKSGSGSRSPPRRKGEEDDGDDGADDGLFIAAR